LRGKVGMKSRAILLLVLKGVTIYSLLLWAYLSLSVIVHPQWQFFNLSIYIPIHEDVLALVSFAVSFVSFIGWQYLEKSPG